MLLSSGPVVLTTIAGGLAGTVGLLPLSGYVSSPIGQPATAAQVVPSAVTFTAMRAHARLGAALSLVGSTITVAVRLVELEGESENVKSASECVLSPSLTGVVGLGTEMSCTSSFSVPLAAGALAFLRAEATATGLSLINTVELQLAVGLAAS